MATFNFKYLIALGSNAGDRLQMLRDACAEIGRSIGKIAAHAGVYETEPMGAADSLFLNSALTLESNLSPQDVMTELLAIEQRLGRVRTEKWGNRTIDLDMLLGETKDNAGNWTPLVLESESLKLPHPEMLKRSFVMLPAVDIASDWVHPIASAALADALKKHMPPKDLQTAKRLTTGLI